VVIDPNNPTGATYPADVRAALVNLADEHNVPLLADEVYADLAFGGPVDAISAQNPDAPVISFSSLSKAYLAPGWRAGWMAVGRTDRLNDVLAGIKKLADGRLCAPGPMQYAIVAALTGDRSHQEAFRAALHERATLTAARLNAIDGIAVVPATAAFYSMPRVALPLVSRMPTTCSGCCARPACSACTAQASARAPKTAFRVVFLASPQELSEIYDDIAQFTKAFLNT
jgi:aspartate/methionine/tyrosine aminotransferase